MALFKRNKPAAQHPITEFWAWWAAEGHRIDPHGVSAITDELSRRIGAIDPGLTWHFSAGTTSQHRLTVSPGGVSAIRPSAARWLRAAPASDATWEFRSSQEADPGALTNVLEIGGHRVELARTVFRVDPVEEELRVHVGVFHDSFPNLPEEIRGQITFLLLDWLLGEDDVERWLGHVEPLAESPATAVTGDVLVAAVQRIAALQDPDAWAIAQWQDADGNPGLLSFRRGLRVVDHPLFDQHLILIARFTPQHNGLPTAGELEVLREAEDELESLIGTRGLIVGHETRDGARTFHVYVDGEDQNVADAVTGWAQRRGMTTTSDGDPGWLAVRTFTG